MRGVLATIVAIGLTIAPANAAAPKADAPAASALGIGVDDVKLTDDSGKSIAWKDLNGRPRAIFFGFTHCPVICPVTVYEIDAALEKIGKPGERLQVIFVTLDPARDTPKAMKDYFSGFKGRVRAITGSEAAIARVAKAFEVEHERVQLKGNDYTLDHTAAVFLVNATGKVVDTVAYGAGPDVMTERLKGLLK